MKQILGRFEKNSFSQRWSRKMRLATVMNFVAGGPSISQTVRSCGVFCVLRSVHYFFV